MTPHRSLAVWFSLLSFFTLASHAQKSAASVQRASERVMYKFQGSASGSLQPESGAATPFSGESFTISVTADAGAVVMSTQPCAVPSGVCELWVAPVTSADISVAGMTATITSPLRIFVNQTYRAVGLQRQTGADLLDLSGHAAFLTYDLAGDLELREPFFKVPTEIGQFDCAHGCVLTSRGSLTVKSVQNVRFTASQIPSEQ